MPAPPQLTVHIDDSVLDRWPSYRAGIVVAHGLHPDPDDGRAVRALRSAGDRGREALGTGSVAEHLHVAAWRAAYREFGSKPSRYRSSVEALLRREVRDGVPSVGPLVDLYNAVSIAHAIPVGGEDLDHVRGGVGLRIAVGGEPFTIRSDGAPETVGVDAGEVVWADDAGVTCRRWNWRQCTRTALTDATRNAYFVLDAIAPLDDGTLERAVEELAVGLREVGGAGHVDAVVLRADGPRTVTR